MDASTSIASGTGSRLTRILLPIAIVAAMLVAMVGIAFYGYHSNRRDAGMLSDELLAVLETRIASEVAGYLAPAERMLKLAKDLALRGALTSDAARNPEAVALNIVRAFPQLAIFSFSDPGGNFLMLKRMPDGTIHTKRITCGDEVKVRWDRRDKLGAVTATEESGDDGYDPRTRPWYLGATAANGLFWTDLYVFFTDRKLGITAALPVHDPRGRLRAVIAADIELSALSEFLAGLDISANGKALIVDDHGRLVAYPDVAKMVARDAEDPRPRTVFELGEPVLERAFNRFRVERHGRRDFDIEGRRYVSIASSLAPAVGRDWTVLIVAPESDFLGFVARNNRTQLFLSGGVLGLAALLAVLMAVQGIRADRNANVVMERQRQLSAQSDAYTALAAKASLFDAGDSNALLDITEIVVQAMGVRRVSVWRVTADEGGALRCEDSYDLDGAGHTHGTVIACSAIAPLWEALHKGDEIVTDDAARDRRTEAFYKLYLDPLGCKEFSAVPVRHAGRTVGAVWLADDAPDTVVDAQALTFARTMANMLALRFAGDAPDATANGTKAQQPASPARPVAASPLTSGPKRMRTLDLCAQRGRLLEARLEQGAVATAAGVEAAGTDVHPRACVMVLRFTDPVLLARRVNGDASSTAANHLVCELQRLGNELGVPYVKIIGDLIVCATGLNGDGADEGHRGAAAHQLADLSLGAQSRCTRICTQLGHHLDFCIGADMGPVMGAAVGDEHAVYNLWGDAVNGATALTTTGTPGCVQVSESIYESLQDHYLFKLRGSYYAAEIGETSTYVLTGKL